MKNLTEWYETTVGFLPNSIKFGLKHNPEFVKVNRAKWEVAIKTLPKQVAPYMMLATTSSPATKKACAKPRSWARPGASPPTGSSRASPAPPCTSPASTGSMQLTKPSTIFFEISFSNGKMCWEGGYLYGKICVSRKELGPKGNRPELGKKAGLVSSPLTRMASRFGSVFCPEAENQNPRHSRQGWRRHQASLLSLALACCSLRP